VETTTTTELGRYLVGVRETSRRQGVPPRVALAAVAAAIATRTGRTDSFDELSLVAGTPAWEARELAPPPDLCTPGLLGEIHQVLVDRSVRRRRGVFYTSPEVAARLVAAAVERWHPSDAPRVCDPAVGGAAFLLAAGAWLEALGFTRSTIVGELLWGVDVDPLAAMVAETVLSLWAAESGVDARPNVATADSLRVGLDAWGNRSSPFDLVVGNPPFQNQLERGTARTRSEMSALRARFGPVASGYSDTASLFLVAACRMLSDGGRAALIVPESFLSARDAEPARHAVTADASLTGLWVPRAALFDAAVRVCVPVLERGAEPGQVSRWIGARMTPAAPWNGSQPAPQSWSPLVGDLLGAPAIVVRKPSVLAERADATAGFRSQFYGLEPFVEESSTRGDDARPRLVTCGRIEPGALAWDRPVRFAGTDYRDPRVDLTRMELDEPSLAGWGAARLVPKVVVATQTRVLEAAVDEHGAWWPSVPVISVHAPADSLWHVAAAINSPFAAAWAFRRAAGSALSGDAIKLSARQLLELPLPPRGDAWDEGAAALARVARASTPSLRIAVLAEFGATMGAAYDTGPEVLEWWCSRLPKQRAARPRTDAAEPPTG
jgi:hypothetical protein